MAHVYKNSYALDVGTTFVELYECTGDEGFYSIVTGMTISNKKLNEVLVDVRIVDATNLITAYLIKDSKLSVGSTLALAGDIQNLVLKIGDKIEVACNETTALDVSMSIMENDPSISYGGVVEGIWYGNIAFFTAGESNGQYISQYTFSTNAMITNIGTWSPHYSYPISASNGTIMLNMGGYSSFSRTEIRSMEFATQVKEYNFGNLYHGMRITEAASNGINFLILGGYGVSSQDATIQKGTFNIGETATYFGEMSWGNRYYQGAAGDDTVALSGGYYSGSNLLHYVEYATESNSISWGNLGYSCYGPAMVSNKEKMIHNTGYSSTINIYELIFASDTASSYFGNLTGYNYEAGGCCDGLLAIFAGGEYSNRSSGFDMYSGTSFTTPQTYYYDGGRPIAESGGAA